MEFPFEFDCQRSGNCCSRPGGFVRVDDADIRAIADEIGMSAAAVRSRYVDASRGVLKSDPSGRCVFLEDGSRAKCEIYPARPRKCQTWPFWEELLRSPELLEGAIRLCPGIRLKPAPDESP